jgi:hypothetical protein
MADRPQKRSTTTTTTASTGSTRDWIVDGIAWEIQTTLMVLPALVVAGIVALLFDASLTMVLVVAVVVAVVIRFALDGWRHLKSADSARSRPPHEDL